MVPGLLWTPLSELSVTDAYGAAIPFQIDEVTSGGEYVCDKGEAPNTADGNGVLDPQDEIVFMAEDATSGEPSRWAGSGEAVKGGQVVPVLVGDGNNRHSACVRRGKRLRGVPKGYIAYDADLEKLVTPFYYARFGHNRFHFVQAGVMDFERGDFIDLTNEMRIIIYVRLFWGLLPIRFTEENMICLVKRYKVGPIRLVRRGDFHLNVGLGLKGSKASVYQICYPAMVSVPVTVHLPIKFSSFFKEAYIEMTPVLRESARGYLFSVPHYSISFPLEGAPVDTLVPVNPDNTFFRVDNGVCGYGWLLNTTIERFGPGLSGYVLQRPSSRGGLAQCGYRLTLEDIPKGYYSIANWVFFSRNSIPALVSASDAIRTPSLVIAGGIRNTNAILNPPEPVSSR